MHFLFVDNILQLEPGKYVKGIKKLHPQEYYQCEDDQEQAYFPYAFIGEALGQLAAWNVMHTNGFTHRPVAGIVSSAVLHSPAFLGQTLLLQSYIDQLDEQAVLYHSEAHVDGRLVFSLEGALGPLLPMADFITQEEVKSQFAAIYPSSSEVKMPSFQGKMAPLMFDNILSSEPGIHISAEKYIKADEPWFADHFPNKPVLPMTVLLECKLNLVQLFLAQAAFKTVYKVKKMQKIKMQTFIKPGDNIACHLTCKAQQDEELILSLKSEVQGKRVCVLEIVLGP